MEKYLIEFAAHLKMTGHELHLVTSDISQKMVEALGATVHHVSVIKGSPLISVITVVEMMRVAQQIYNENYRPFEVLLGVAIIFFVINFTLTRVAGRVERRIAVRLA
jgi:ABC-type amino acid transport system permease subunit